MFLWNSLVSAMLSICLSLAFLSTSQFLSCQSSVLFPQDSAATTKACIKLSLDVTACSGIHTSAQLHCELVSALRAHVPGFHRVL